MLERASLGLRAEAGVRTEHLNREFGRSLQLLRSDPAPARTPYRQDAFRRRGQNTPGSHQALLDVTSGAHNWTGGLEEILDEQIAKKLV